MNIDSKLKIENLETDLFIEDLGKIQGGYTNMTSLAGHEDPNFFRHAVLRLRGYGRRNPPQSPRRHGPLAAGRGYDACTLRRRVKRAKGRCEWVRTNDLSYCAVRSATTMC